MLGLVISYDQQTCERTHNCLFYVYSHFGFSLKIDRLFSCSYFVSYFYLGRFSRFIGPNNYMLSMLVNGSRYDDILASTSSI